MRSLVLALTALLAAGCTVANAIDVCDRAAPDERQVNQNATCDQAVASSQALGVLPGVGAMVSFGSVQSAQACGTGNVDAVVALVGYDGTASPACSGTSDEVVSGTRAMTRTSIAMAPPTDAMHLGLVVFDQAVTGVATPHVMGTFVDAAGCPSTTEPFQIDVTSAGHIAEAPSVARIGDNLFLVVWNDLQMVGEAIQARALARVVDAELQLVASFPGTVPDPSGNPVPLDPGGNDTAYPFALALPNDQAAVFWYAPDYATEVRFTIFDNRLTTLSPTRAVDIGPERDDTFSNRTPHEALAAATDGAQILAAWTLADSTGATDIRARFFDLTGQALSSPDSPDGSPFRLATSTQGSANHPSLVGLSGGGFLAAWDAQGVAGGEDSDGSGIRATAFEPDGTRRFADRTCGPGDFQLNHQTADDQTHPSLVAADDGTVLAVWTDAHPSLGDSSGAHVQSVALRPRDLFGIR